MCVRGGVVYECVCVCAVVTVGLPVSDSSGRTVTTLHVYPQTIPVQCKGHSCQRSDPALSSGIHL